MTLAAMLPALGVSCVCSDVPRAELPFGRGRKWGGDSSTVMDAILGAGR
jgi:hypothetical protein